MKFLKKSKQAYVHVYINVMPVTGRGLTIKGPNEFLNRLIVFLHTNFLKTCRGFLPLHNTAVCSFFSIWKDWIRKGNLGGRRIGKCHGFLKAQCFAFAGWFEGVQALMIMGFFGQIVGIFILLCWACTYRLSMLLKVITMLTIFVSCKGHLCFLTLWVRWLLNDGPGLLFLWTHDCQKKFHIVLNGEMLDKWFKNSLLVFVVLILAAAVIVYKLEYDSSNLDLDWSFYLCEYLLNSERHRIRAGDKETIKTVCPVQDPDINWKSKCLEWALLWPVSLSTRFARQFGFLRLKCF